MEPRGIRNNNPLNIRLSSDKWQGQINGKGNIDGNSSLSSERAGGEAVFVCSHLWSTVGERPL